MTYDFSLIPTDPAINSTNIYNISTSLGALDTLVDTLSTNISSNTPLKNRDTGEKI